MSHARPSGAPRHFGFGWLFLTLAFAAHVADEALTHFLDVYNPTVLAVRARFPGFPMPTFGFREWLIGLIVAILVCFSLTPFAFRNARWLRPLAYFYAGIHLLNATGHTLATIFGQTVSSVHVLRPAPGFYSSPFLFVGSIYLLMQLRRSSRSPQDTPGN